MIYAILVLTLLALNCGAIWCSGYVIRLFMFLQVKSVLPQFSTVLLGAFVTYAILGFVLFLLNTHFFKIKKSILVLIFFGVTLLICLLPIFYPIFNNAMWEPEVPGAFFVYLLGNVPLLFIVTPVVFGLLSAATSE